MCVNNIGGRKTDLFEEVKKDGIRIKACVACGT
jgi:hypothetical protein